LPQEGTSRVLRIAEAEALSSTLGRVSFERGDVILRREVWRGTPHHVHTVRVVDDTGSLLIVYLAPGTPLISPEGSWPWSASHPWAAQEVWAGMEYSSC
jgi:hypothetical protein